jgi:hypothetical protein
MPILSLIFTLVVAIMLAWAGWFLLFRTRSMVQVNPRVPERSGSLPKAHYASLASQRWFPLVLRFQGILRWLGAVFLLGVAASAVLFR